MADPTVPEVRAIVTTGKPDAFVTACIAATKVVIARIPTGGDGEPTEADNHQVWIWLAAHWVVAGEPGANLSAFTMAGAAAIKEVYGGKFALGLDGSRYGQAAKAMDKTGTLKTLDSKKLSAKFRVIDFDKSTYAGQEIGRGRN